MGSKYAHRPGGGDTPSHVMIRANGGLESLILATMSGRMRGGEDWEMELTQHFGLVAKWLHGGRTVVSQVKGG